MDFPELPNPFNNKTDLVNVMKNMTELKKNMPIINKPTHSTKSTNIKKLKFTIKKDFPSLIGSEPKRKKRIRKKPKNQGKLIKRFDCELINISEKIKEVCEKKNLVFRRTNEKAYKPMINARKKKLSRIKKAVIAAKEVVNYQDAIKQLDNSDLDKGITVSKDDIQKQNSNIITRRIRQNFNNSETVKKGYNNDISIREYVDNILDPKFDENILKLINRLTFAYMLKKAQTPLKAKKRVVSGFNEVSKSLNFVQKQK